MKINIYFCDYFSYFTQAYILTNKILPSEFSYFVAIGNIGYKTTAMNVQLVVDIDLFPIIHNNKKVNKIGITSSASKRFIPITDIKIIDLLEDLNDHKCLVGHFKENEIDNLISIVNLGLYND